jgi:outer membrane lipoprotein-sorting protein
MRLSLSLVLLLPVAVKRASAQAAPASIPEATQSSSAPGGVVSPETLLTDPARDPAWRELFVQLAPNKTRRSTFEERRYFPFRKEPVILQGEIRIVPERGLSLRYLEPEPRILIVDHEGLLMRDAEGRERAALPDSRAQVATSALVQVLRFDFDALNKQFEVYGRRNGETWNLAFVPRDSAFADMLGTLTVSGEQNELRRIEMIKSPTQRIEIIIKETQEDVLFTADTLRRFFR